MALPLFAVTMFVSAFVLFLVQPMIGKMILPKLGGTPQVWNTCMVFFQSALLAGYAYAHFLSTRLSLRRQLIIHSAVLFIPILVLVPPIGPFNVAGWVPPAGSNPIFNTLGLLAIIVGLPFFVVSTTAPLLQKWFSRAGHATSNDPYYLYSASNIGSLLSLVAYPFVIEPIIGLSEQTVTWAVLYVVLGCLIAGCAIMLRKVPGALDEPIASPEMLTPEQPVPPHEVPPTASSTAVKSGPAPGAARGGQKKKPFKTGAVPAADVRSREAVGHRPSEAPVTAWRRIRWILLAMIPSSLMLGVTAYVSTDLSPFPLIWAIPLCLYLISFILVFSRWPTAWTAAPHDFVLFLQPFGLLGMGFVLLAAFNGAYLQPMFIAFGGFFITALAAHGELARDRPSPRHLTEFFLLMSFGGMLGGFFNGILAPILFTWVMEFPLAVILACFLRPIIKRTGWTEDALVQSFPNLEAWAVRNGDGLAASMNRRQPHSPYLLAWIFDIIHGIVSVVVIFLAIRFFFGAFEPSRPFTDQTVGLMKALGWTDPTRASAESFGRLVFLLIPLVFLFFFSSRPVRLGLGLFTLLWLYIGFLGVPSRDYLPGGAKRTYFGVLRVFEHYEQTTKGKVKGRVLNADDGKRYLFDRLTDETLVARGTDGAIDRVETKRILGVDFPARDAGGNIVTLRARSTSLTHGTTHHGENYHYPPGLRRLATTYYHRLGPIGAVMERYNWFEINRTYEEKQRQNRQGRHHADVRLPAAMVGDGFAALGLGLPVEAIANAWSEPPIATIGLGTGTMASYGRPYQHIVFYEIDDEIRKFCEPYQIGPDYSEIPATPEGWAKERMTDPLEEIARPYFTYLRDASLRGANVEVIMGDARLSMENRLKKDITEKELGEMLTRYPDDRYPFREDYYKVIVVDAFSSDAIPVHLITEEAIQVYLAHLTEDGVICVHTSNRHVDLVQPVVNIAAKLRLDWRVGKDLAPRVSLEGKSQPALGHTGSEYVMLAKTPGILKDDYGLPGENLAKTEVFRFRDRDGKTQEMIIDSTVWENQPVGRALVGWSQPRPPDHRVWTDDYSNILQIYR